MIANRSVPVDTVLPHLAYRNVADAIAWLNKAFGFKEQYRYGEQNGVISGAQLRRDMVWIMVHGARQASVSPAESGSRSQGLTVFVDDVDGHFRQAKAAGAKIFEELHETEYGERQYGAEDLDGHQWLFSCHVRDASPDDWGAKVSETTNRIAQLRRPRLCYLEIPSTDLKQSVLFYVNVFGWNVRGRDSERPSFDDATGDVSGAWVKGRSTGTSPGLLPYIWVDSLDQTLSKVTASGGVILENAHPDSPGGTSWIATIRDPSKNVIGLYQENVDESRVVVKS